MKKSLVALATLSVVGSAFADIDVSGGIKMYGVIDQAVTSQTLTDPSVAARSTNYTSLFAAAATSRLGFKGTRDLGQGIKGRFQAEIQVEPDNATMLPAKNRGTFVGISKESAGEIILGTQETTAYEIFGMDVNGRVEYKPQVWRTTTSSDTQDRANNSLKYVSPSIGGFTAHAMRGFADTSSTTSTAYTSLGVKFSQDKMRAALVVDRLTNTAGSFRFAGLVNAGPGKEGATYTSTALAYSGSTTTAVTRNIGSISYDFGVASVNYLYAKSYSGGTNAGSLTTNTFGIRVPYENFAFALSYGAGTIDSYTTAGSGLATAGDSTINDTTFGLYYNLDKSTSFYLLGSTSNLSTGGGYVQAGKNVTTAIGARYNF
jgi:predicted porin